MSRRDNTLLTVGFNLRIGDAACHVSTKSRFFFIIKFVKGQVSSPYPLRRGIADASSPYPLRRGIAAASSPCSFRRGIDKRNNSFI